MTTLYLCWSRKGCACPRLYMSLSFTFFLLQSGKAHQVMQFHIVNWGPDGRCSNLKTVTDVIEEVSKVQRRTGNNPIVVHCR